jgi:hypothetical protein
MTDAPQSHDAYATLTGLIALLVDSKACAKRIDELQKLEERIAAAQARLDADRAEYDQHVAATKAELAAREAVVAGRLVRAMQLEAQHPEVSEEGTPEVFPFDPNLNPGTRSHTGLVRARHHE